MSAIAAPASPWCPKIINYFQNFTFGNYILDFEQNKKCIGVFICIYDFL